MAAGSCARERQGFSPPEGARPATIARMPVVQTTIEVQASVEDAFAYVDNYRTVPEWMFGLVQFEPVGARDHGLGAIFDGTMKVGVPLTSQVEVTAWEQDELIELSSIKGIRNAWQFTFHPVAADRCRVDVHVTYELPGGPIGKGMAAAVKPMVGVAVDRTTAAVRRHFER